MPKKQTVKSPSVTINAVNPDDIAKAKESEGVTEETSKVSNVAELEGAIISLKAEKAHLEAKLAKLDHDHVRNSYKTIFGRLEPKLENPSETVKRSASLKTGKIRTVGEGDLKGLSPHEARLYCYASKVEAALFNLTKLIKDGAPKA